MSGECKVYTYTNIQKRISVSRRTALRELAEERSREADCWRSEKREANWWSSEEGKSNRTRSRKPEALIETREKRETELLIKLHVHPDSTNRRS